MVRVDPFFVGRVQAAQVPPTPRTLDVDVLMGKALALWENLVELDGKYSRETIEVLKMNVEAGPGLFSDLVASYLNVSLEEKQKLVEMLVPRERVRRLIELIEAEIGKITVDRDIKGQVKVDIEKKQREYFLREQVRIIQEELGETREAQKEAAEYQARVDTLPIDEESKDVLRKECKRLSILSEQSADYPVIRNYLETVFSLPWNQRTTDSLDLRKAERLLTKNHHALGDVKDRIVEYLAVARLKGHLAGPVLCLVGPPGVGKTTLGRSVAEALGRKFIRISLGGVSDESEIRGHRKTYVGAMPGKIIAAYARVGSKNPVILIDEIDKLGKDFRGDPASALLEVLDPEQNKGFLDRYLGIPFDLSETLFIATANMLDTVPPALRDRFETITLAGYTEEEKVAIARRYVLPRTLETHGLPARSVQITDDAIVAVIRGWTAEAGVRELERKLATICRKIARERADSRERRQPARKVVLKGEEVTRHLGPVVFEHEYAERSPEVGLATGLAWTAAGGAILFIEATRMPGAGRIEVTGQLGEVMKESVQAAISYVRSRAGELEISPEVFRESDIHIHFPAGATPKDGPSAGVAVATCLASLLAERPIRHDVAMTGEITLRGKVLSVGGVKEKVLAAHRAMIKTVILPSGNRKDLVKIPEEVRRDLKVVFADRVEDCWREALMPILVPRGLEKGRRFDEAEFVAEQRGESTRRRDGGSGRRGEPLRRLLHFPFRGLSPLPRPLRLRPPLLRRLRRGRLGVVPLLPPGEVGVGSRPGGAGDRGGAPDRRRQGARAHRGGRSRAPRRPDPGGADPGTESAGRYAGETGDHGPDRPFPRPADPRRPRSGRFDLPDRLDRPRAARAAPRNDDDHLDERHRRGRFPESPRRPADCPGGDGRDPGGEGPRSGPAHSSRLRRPRPRPGATGARELRLPPRIGPRGNLRGGAGEPDPPAISAGRLPGTDRLRRLVRRLPRLGTALRPRTQVRSGAVPRLAPSLLSADFADLGAALALCEKAGADLVHVDVMDGHFVPNLTIGPPVVASLRRRTKLPFDVHLMIERPLDWVERYVEAGANRVSFHVEAEPHLRRTLARIREAGASPGLAINPGSSLSLLEEALPDADFVLVMSVDPGFSGQAFEERSVDKVRRLRQMAAERGLETDITVDGGVDDRNVGRLAAAGASTVVAGHGFFRAADPIAAARAFHEAGALRA